MGNYENLKSAISNAIKTNGNGEITGEVLQSTLLSIVNAVGEFATFAGVATPSTNPGVPDQNVFYLASEAGFYNNFTSGLELPAGLNVLYSHHGGWSSAIILHDYLGSKITLHNFNFEQGSIDSKGNEYAKATSVRSTYIYTNQVIIPYTYTYKYAVAWYDSAQNFIGVDGYYNNSLNRANSKASYARIIIAYIDNADIGPSAISNLELDVIRPFYSTSSVKGGLRLKERSTSLRGFALGEIIQSSFSILLDAFIDTRAEFMPFAWADERGSTNVIRANNGTIYSVWGQAYTQYGAYSRIIITCDSGSFTVIINGIELTGTTAMTTLKKVGCYFNNDGVISNLRVFNKDITDELDFIMASWDDHYKSDNLVLEVLPKYGFANTSDRYAHPFLDIFDIVDMPEYINRESGKVDLVTPSAISTDNGGAFLNTTIAATTPNLIFLRKGESISLRSPYLRGMKLLFYKPENHGFVYCGFFNANNAKESYLFTAPDDIYLRVQTGYFSREDLDTDMVSHIASSYSISRGPIPERTNYLVGDFAIISSLPEYTGITGQDLSKEPFGRVYALWDSLVNDHPDSMHKELLGYGTSTSGGVDSTLPIYQYTYSPLIKPNTSYESEVPFPVTYKKILLSSGVHGQEKVSVRALYLFAVNLLESPEKSFSEMRSNFEFKFIPLVVPNSYTDVTRLNKRGVNIARNMGYNWKHQQAHDVADKGEYAYSERESQIYSQWLFSNKDAFIHLDVHDSAYQSRYAELATYFYSSNENLLNLYASFSRRLSEKILTDTPTLTPQVFSYVGQDEIAGTFAEGFSIAGIENSSVVEINNYFLENRQYTRYQIELHTWQVTNWLLTLIKYLSK